ncbi:hypothetical protein BDN67DRAFT_908618, partial [Paxillus ammoniavirescens]
STHNTQIEQLWVEVGQQFARHWKAFFMRLEQLHGLDCKNPRHLWLLQFLFLDLINIDCKIFMEEWNHHPISGPVTKNQSPSVIENGVYIDDPFQDVDPDLLTHYYGTGGEPLSFTEQAEAEELQGDLEAQITADMQQNLHDEPVPMPDHSNPFSSPEIIIFRKAVAEAEMVDLLPDSPVFPATHWDLHTYDTHEDIDVGFRKTKTLTIHLPPDVWMPQALAWAQGLTVMEHMLLAASL